MDHHDGWSLAAPVEIVDVCPVSTGHKARDWLWLRRARRSGKREGENNYGGTKKGLANEHPFQHLASQAHNPELHRIRGTTQPVGVSGQADQLHSKVLGKPRLAFFPW